MLYRFLWNEVRREGNKPSPSLASGHFYYAAFHNILHGRRIDYGTAKLSVQGLLLLLVLATLFVDLETGRAVDG